jgi:hypothetical protein
MVHLRQQIQHSFVDGDTNPDILFGVKEVDVIYVIAISQILTS